MELYYMHVYNTGKDSDAGRDWGQEEKGTTEDEMASWTWWMWVWVNSRRRWWTGRPGVLRFMGPQRVGHDWVTDLNWCNVCKNYIALSPSITVRLLTTKDKRFSILTVALPSCLSYPMFYYFYYNISLLILKIMLLPQLLILSTLDSMDSLRCKLRN